MAFLLVLMKLRFYQNQAFTDILNGFQQFASILYVLATGGGKTVIFSRVIAAFVEAQHTVCAIAHRQELVVQISVSLARSGIEHRIIAPDKVIRLCVKTQVRKVGKSFYNANANVGVAGVDTLTSKRSKVTDPSFKRFLKKVTLVVQDEGHHVLAENKWGRAFTMFPNAKLLGVTATPTRADGKGLGITSHGLYEKMIVGETMRGLIDQGFLCDYRIFAPPSDIDLTNLKVGSTGDVSSKELRKRIEQSHIIGDIVDSYIKHANGLRGVTFVPDVKTAGEVAAAFVAKGVPALAVSSNSTDVERITAVDMLEKGEVLQLVNVDLFGEGFDLPAISVVSFARKTESYSLYVQQFGRALRIMEGKEYAIIIDHVGNVIRHGLPDKEIEWTLEPRSARSSNKSDDELPTRVCVNCTSVFESWEKKCIYCGHVPVPLERTTPEAVEGDLTEMPPELLEQLRRKVSDSNSLKIPYAAAPVVVSTAKKRYRERKEAVETLNNKIDQWAGNEISTGLSLSATYMKFYKKFNVDAISASSQSLSEINKMLESLE